MPPWLEGGRLRSAELDRRCAVALHRGAARPRVLALLVVCSRLGNGQLWVAVIVALPLAGGEPGPACALQMAILGLLNLLIYWTVKRLTRRQRPFERCPGIQACAHPADPFSFPSGHTLHAVSFAVLLSAHYPAFMGHAVLPPLLWVFASLVATSRVVLGLHYPSDVLAGAVLAIGTALLVLQLS